MKPTILSIFLAGLFAHHAHAASIPTFTLLPPSGTISGNSAGVVGWGYDIANNDSVNWLVLDDSFVTGSLGSGTFGTYVDYLANNFIVIDPGSSTGTVPFSRGTSGTGEFDIDAFVPPNAIIPGTIAIDYSVFSQNPNSPSFDPGSFLGNGNVSATAQLDVNTSAVPEPGSVWLIAAGLLPLAWGARRCRRT